MLPKIPAKAGIFLCQPLDTLRKVWYTTRVGEGYPQRLAAEKTLKKFKKTLDKHPSLCYNRCGRAFVTQKITSSLYYWRRAPLTRNKIKSSSHYYWRGYAASKKIKKKILNANENHSHLRGKKIAESVSALR
jgi:hypothetical protein